MEKVKTKGGVRGEKNDDDTLRRHLLCGVAAKEAVVGLAPPIAVFNVYV